MAHSVVSASPSLARRDQPFVLRAIGQISTLCGWFAAALIVVSIFITCHMIFVRFVLRQSTIWQTEVVIYMMIATTTIGLAYVQKLRGHVNVDLVPAMLPYGVRRALAYLVLLLTMAVVATIAWYAAHTWYETFDRNWKSSTVWGVRLWIPWLAVPVGFVLYLLQLAADFFALYLRIDEPFGKGRD
ncbi:TRAP transporter small permease subunit [Tianweitania sediminis]|uniref:TRAP transporter small permease protein n=1 Tax=Tianweitania sediminis TaxID=1502156 RepID=A0A8J7R147_9HYPH|nr:TRAP transporter small permease [Tianweitania sediminis]MBP0438256.1 TRAP transporter small permease [Tianweitania sediminis]